MISRVRVFIASSIDGFIAGPDDDLSWLPEPTGDEVADDHGYTAFMAEIGVLLMGRRTFDVVAGFGGEWPYGDRPILVATHRPLPESAPRSVRAVSGSITAIVDEARAAAGEKDVYIDGGVLIRQALDADLIDELVISLIPVVLGAGHPLFAGATRRHSLELVDSTRHGALVQLCYRPSTSPQGS